MLVFKDSIMGFVSGVQLSANDMLKVGDWIAMPKYGGLQADCSFQCSDAAADTFIRQVFPLSIGI